MARVWQFGCVSPVIFLPAVRKAPEGTAQADLAVNFAAAAKERAGNARFLGWHHRATEEVVMSHQPIPRHRVTVAVDDATRRLYDAETALHTANTSQIDAWISAAADRLHEAVEAYLAAIATN
jgi:hypothetical protein